MLRLTRLSAFFVIRRGDYRIRFHSAAIPSNLWVEPAQEFREENFVRAYLQPLDVYVDVGANIGILVLSASGLVGEEGRILAIEPHPVTFKFLVENIRLNKRTNITASNVAVVDRPSQVFVTSLYSDNQNRVHTLEAGIAVEGTTLDQLTADFRRIALLKIDVEGGEGNVLKGAERTLARTDTVLFEYGQTMSAAYGYSFCHLYDLLAGAGFRIGRLVGKEIVPMARTHRCLDAADYVAYKDSVNLQRRTGLRIADASTT
jgi:FkbM family methyltransferase